MTTARGKWLKPLGAMGSLVGATLLVVAVSGPHAADHPTGGPDPQAAATGGLKRLVDGNARFVAGKPTRPGQDAGRRVEVAAGQKPFALVVGCADSRVPPEVLFDQGLGDLFVVRTAGQVIDKAALGSIEYGVEHLHIPLLVVLGHSKCGAVQATCDAVTKGGGKAPGEIGFLIDEIRPAVEHVKAEQGDLVANAVEANVERVVEELSEAKPIVAELAEAHKLTLQGGVYDLTSGKVSWLKH